MDHHEYESSRTVQGLRNQHGTATILPESQTAGLGRIRIQHPRGTFALTPASLISLAAICSHQDKLTGVGIDWGSGTGCLAITAARVEAVRRVYGVEIDPANVKAARMNVRLNAVQRKVSIFHADSYRPYSQLAKRRFKSLHGAVDFLLANPPSSEGDDGFAFRREVLRGGRPYLRSRGIVFLSISSQYGPARIHRLVREVPGYSYRGLLSTTELVPFDLTRPDLLHCLELYAAEEEYGGLRYTFYDPRSPETTISATSALDLSRRTGTSPLMRWQVHLFAAG
jgi:hypothetical protein